MIGRFIMSGTLAGTETFSHGFGFQDDTSTTAAEASVNLNILANAMLDTNFLAQYRPNVVWTKYRTVRIDPTTGLQLDISDTTVNKPGTEVSGNQLPLEVACCITLRGALSTRHSRGRFYLPPPSTTRVDSGGFWSTAFTGVLVTSLSNAFNAYNDLNHTIMVFRKETIGMIGTPIIKFDIGSVPDSQRRRRKGLVETRVGANIT